jgi:hypothetical protein
MTEKEIIKQLSHWLDDRKYPFRMPNAFVYKWECDYWAMTSSGICREFEIKISRADYFNDAKKDKHKVADGANYFYYVVPKDMIKPAEVDPKYGLIYVWDTGFVQVIKKPRQLHASPFDDWKMLANKMYWRFRQLWREKYMAKEISRDEYIDGFNLSLEETESIDLQSLTT